MSAIYSYFKRKASKSQTICRCVPVLLALLLLLVFFAGCETEKLTSLRTFSMPEMGAYQCVEARWGERDLLALYPKVTLTLRADGTFLFEAKPLLGKTVSREGGYSFEDGAILFTAEESGKSHSLRVPLENGTFCISRTFGGETLFLKFVAA